MTSLSEYIDQARAVASRPDVAELIEWSLAVDPVPDWMEDADEHDEADQ